MEITTFSAKGTQAFGKTIAKSLQTGHVIALYGDLGSGKTTFVQGFAKGLGVNKRIISPTFIIMRTYAVTKDKITYLYHLDLYRLEQEEEIRSLGIFDLFTDKENIIVIEWAEKIEKLLPKKRIDIYFEYLTEQQRKIVVIQRGENNGK